MRLASTPKTKRSKRRKPVRRAAQTRKGRQWARWVRREAVSAVDPRFIKLKADFADKDSESDRRGAPLSAMILRIDIGLKGAIALVDESGELVEVFDMPTLADGPKDRPALSAPLLAEILPKTHPVHAYVEHVGPQLLEGAVGAFAFGRCKGVVEGVCAPLSPPVTFLSPPVWKRLVGIPSSKVGAKDAARSEAIRRWPGQAELFARAKDDGRAESALIALAGLKRECGGAP